MFGGVNVYALGAYDHVILYCVWKNGVVSDRFSSGFYSHAGVNYSLRSVRRIRKKGRTWGEEERYFDVSYMRKRFDKLCNWAYIEASPRGYRVSAAGMRVLHRHYGDVFKRGDV